MTTGSRQRHVLVLVLACLLGIPLMLGLAALSQYRVTSALDHVSGAVSGLELRMDPYLIVGTKPSAHPSVSSTPPRWRPPRQRYASKPVRFRCWTQPLLQGSGNVRVCEPVK